MSKQFDAVVPHLLTLKRDRGLRTSARAAYIHSTRTLIFSLFAGLAAAASDAAMAQPASAPPSSYFHKRLAGKLADKYGITMDLKNLDGRLSGTYRYGGRKSDLYLSGKIDSAGSFVMEESTGSKTTGTFTGTISPSGDAVGSWRSPDGKRTLAFEAHQLSEVRIGSKQEILSAAVGTYRLKSLGGAGGANSMWDTWKDRGRWRSNHSGLSGGMREAEEIALTSVDIKLLDALRVVIGADLSVRVIAPGKTLLAIPFEPNGLAYDLDRSRDNPLLEPLQRLSARTTTYDEELYLLVREHVDYSAALSGSFRASTSGTLVVTYSVVWKTIEMRFIDDDCCGGTSWMFEPIAH